MRRERRGERRGEERGRGVRGEREESRGGEGRERMRGERRGESGHVCVSGLEREQKAAARAVERELDKRGPHGMLLHPRSASARVPARVQLIATRRSQQAASAIMRATALGLEGGRDARCIGLVRRVVARHAHRRGAAPWGGGGGRVRAGRARRCRHGHKR